MRQAVISILHVSEPTPHGVAGVARARVQGERRRLDSTDVLVLSARGG